jgi:hypothetical protein
MPSWERLNWKSDQEIFRTKENDARSTLRVAVADEGNLDAFGRLKVANPITIFDSQMQYDTQPLLWVEKIEGTASVTHNPNESTADLTVGTTAGDSVIRQTREYFRYQPGKAQSILCTGVLGLSQEGTTRLIGYGDGKNGVFFGCDGGGHFVLLRTNITGTPSDARKVYTQDWNIDSLDGTGRSGITFDPESAQIFAMDMEWLGVGRVRMGLVIGGRFIYVHEFFNANSNPTTYMTTANLPVRYEIRNDTNVAASSTLKHICSQVVSEGGIQDTAAYPFGTEVTDVEIPAGAENAIVVFAARHSPTFNGIENRIKWLPLGYETLPLGGRLVTRILYNPTLVGGTWNSIDPNSAIEGNVGVTSFSNGIEVQSALAAGANAKSTTGVFGNTATDRLPFGLDIDGANPVSLALVAYALDNGVSSSFAFQWEEVR